MTTHFIKDMIIVSAKTEVSDKVDLLLGGKADYITKSFDTSEEDYIEAVWGIISPVC